MKRKEEFKNKQKLMDQTTAFTGIMKTNVFWLRLSGPFFYEKNAMTRRIMVEKAPAECNSAQCKPAFRYAVFILWEGINYRKSQYTCQEDAVCALLPHHHDKIMGYKNK